VRKETFLFGEIAISAGVISNTTSLIVLNLPRKLSGKEKDLVAGCRAQGFGIWPTLSEPVQVRIGILNQLSPQQITEITSRFADAMLAMGAQFDKAKNEDIRAALEQSVAGDLRQKLAATTQTLAGDRRGGSVAR
jgi:hypothetical protein